MTAHSSIPVRPKHQRSRLGEIADALASHPLAAALAIVATVTALRFTGTVDSDVAWQLWIAHQVNGGARLYRDIVEVNPPLWFWMALPMDAAATALHLRVETVAIAVMGALSALALAATSLLVSAKPARGGLFLGYAALILMAMPWMHVGQREQIALIGALPYAALIAARCCGREVPPPLAAAIGFGASIGFALKPYFLLVPALLELWLIGSRAKSWRPFRPETVALAATGVLYALAVLLFAGDYLTLTLPLVRLAYGVTGAPHLADLFAPSVLAASAAVALVAAQSKLRSAHVSLPAALTVAAIGFAGAYFIQAKGWAYHAIPLLGCASLALAARLSHREATSRLTRLAAPAVLCLPLLLAFSEARGERAPGDDLVQAFDGIRAGDSVGFIATDPALAWSIALQRSVAYPSRYMGFWMMRAIIANEAQGDPDKRLSDLGRQVVAQTVADFRCLPPRRIIVARPRPGEDGFDILPYFERDPGFHALLAHYRPVSRTTVEVFDLQLPYPPSAASGCRTVVR